VTYDAEDQSHHLVQDLIDHMGNFQEFDNVVSLLIEWDLISPAIGAIANEMWKETKE
jgi:hypothetical protein